jgi:hypothetical protein
MFRPMAVGLMLGCMLAGASFAADEKVDPARLAANETAAANSCKAFAEAEEIFRRTDYDNDGILEYAQALRGLPPPAPEIDPAKVPQAGDDEKKKIGELIKKMSSDEFTVREQAFADIKAFKTKALPTLKDALKTEKDAEIVNRCKNLVSAIEQELAPQSAIPPRCNLLEFTPGAGDLALIDKTFGNAECYLGADASKITPKAGYLFRVLTKQGAAATGGKRNYIASGNMTLGYALVAFPKEYGATGKKVFCISNNGTIFEKDFGSKEKTDEYIKTCDEFNPTPDWAASE